MEVNAIEARRLKKGFDGNPVLKEVNFTLKTGEVHALVGQNGAGKSTLVKLINGFHQRDGGEIRLFGEQSHFATPKEAQAKGIAMVYQDLSLIPSLSVADNIFLTHSQRSALISNRDRVRQAEPILATLGVDIDPRQKVETLSVGEQQFIEIAKAMAMDARILVLDEPTASLSNNEINALFTVIRNLKSKGISIIYITHYMSDIMRICDAVTVLRDGYSVLETQTADTSVDALVEAMLGSKTDTDFVWERPATSTPETVPLLELCNVTTCDLDDVSLKVMPGQVVGLAGLLGSGRTEILEAIYGLTPIQSGEVRVNGQVVNIHSPRQAIESGINMVPEERRSQGLVLDFSVEDNVLMASFDRISRSMVLDKAKGQSMVEDTIKKLGVKTTGVSQPVRFLSGGNQQKVVIGKCLSTDAKVLLLDDPTFGIDINAKYEIMKIVNQYVAQGNGVIFVSSEYAEVGSFCDVIYVVNKGRIVRHFSGQRMTEEALLAAVQ
ncbi:sugar ABC transporter ATP-binding protein [Photobacterium sp. Hal280]|uniref:sugar ABC transporter ATP-binding protein n=1 Tax=Photobacterium sp. Hal280 TaxID=3035163 RepID=UPI00301C59C1